MTTALHHSLRVKILLAFTVASVAASLLPDEAVSTPETPPVEVQDASPDPTRAPCT